MAALDPRDERGEQGADFDGLGCGRIGFDMIRQLLPRHPDLVAAGGFEIAQEFRRSAARNLEEQTPNVGEGRLEPRPRASRDLDVVDLEDHRRI
jgi:hypothetical protein